MKTKEELFTVFFTALFLTCALLASGQSQSTNFVLPSSGLDNRQQHQYLVETDYLNFNIYGDFASRMRISGKYTSGLPDGKVEWADAYLQKSDQPDGPFVSRENLDYVNGFSYTYEQNILAPEFFAGFPNNSVEAKNLVWDMAGMEFFAWGHTDSLQLNVPYHANQANGPVELAGHGFFDNRDIILTWKGMTTNDNETLAMIDFRTMNNKLEVQVDMGDRHFQTKGRSHYWGTIWLSVDQHCIDRIELFEDVVLEIGWNDQAEKELVDVVREMRVTKIY